MPFNELKAPVSISVLSTAYVKCQISATEGGTTVDPTSGTVEFAFISEALGTSPVSGDWKAGSWETGSDGGYWGRCLVGPSGTVTLAAGSYDVWTRITKAPETVVKRVGILVIT